MAMQKREIIATFPNMCLCVEKRGGYYYFWGKRIFGFWLDVNFEKKIKGIKWKNFKENLRNKMKNLKEKFEEKYLEF